MYTVNLWTVRTRFQAFAFVLHAVNRSLNGKYWQPYSHLGQAAIKFHGFSCKLGLNCR